MTRRAVRIPIALALLLGGLLLPQGQPARVVLLLAAYAIAGYDVLYGALRGILGGQVIPGGGDGRFGL